MDLLGDTLGDALETDFVRIADEFGPQERDYLERTRTFVRDEVLPVIAGYWERAEFPFALARRMGELGLIGHGGEGADAMSPASAGLIAMELSRGDGSLATFAGVQAGLVMRSIEQFGSPEQKARWLAEAGEGRSHRRIRAHGARPRIGLAAAGDHRRGGRRGIRHQRGKALDR